MQLVQRATPVIVFHYDEIGLKGGNRPRYEHIFLNRLREQLQRCGVTVEKLVLRESRVVAIGAAPLSEAAKGRLARTPGVASFGSGVLLPRDASEQEIASAARGFAALLQQRGSTFRITAHRADKYYPKTSPEIERWLGEAVGQEAPSLRVQLRKPENNLVVEVLHSSILLWIREDGVGGLPVGASGDAVCLLSSGFDSPVASYLMMKRGVRVHWLHFHAAPATGEEAREVARALAAHLAQWSDRKARFATMNVFLLTKLLIKQAQEKMRVVLLRRSMMRLAERWARQLRAEALITGESVGQVASQTLSNIATITAATTLPVLRPLSGFNKNEIIRTAEWLGTAPLSSRKCDDTCAMLTPRHPATKTQRETIEREEERIGIRDREAAVFQTLEENNLNEEGEED